MAGFLDRLGRAAARHRWQTLAIWVLVICGVAAGAVVANGSTVDVFAIPGAESQRATDLLAQRFPSQSGDMATVVFAAPHGTLRRPETVRALAATQARLDTLPHVTQVVGPATPDIGSAFVSSDARIAYAGIQYDAKSERLASDTVDRLRAAATPAEQAGVRVEFGGAVIDAFSGLTTGGTEGIGILAAVVILLLAFGSLIAMGVPIFTALFGLAIGMSLVFLLAATTDIGTAAPTLASMIGLGVGIDYSLFIVTRYRQNLAAGMTVIDSIGLANGTAGESVLFAGGTVVIAICGLAVAGIPYIAWLGFTSAIVVLVMIAAALSLVPALLGIAGEHINRLRAPRVRRAARSPSHPSLTGGRSHGWARWAQFVARHRWGAVLASLAVLLTLAAPALSMRLGQIDDGSAPTSTTQRQAYDLIAKGFGKGFNGPLVLAMEFRTVGAVKGAAAVAAAAARIRGVVVSPPQLSPRRDAAVVVVVPSSAPQSAATANLVDRLRRHVLPPAVKGTGATVFVGGITAVYIDLGERIQSRLPLFIGAVVGLSFFLLMIVFRSVLVPLKAAIMNLLSIGASFGVIVAVFQWGWLKGLFGLSQTTPIIAFIPMIMFAILFGLSMDYEVFLLSRIREDYTASRDNLNSVVHGLAVTARVITSAALIMISVFLGFIGNPDPSVKMAGLGLAVAVLVDATVVRLILVPATMGLLGDANWWLPAWLGRILPRVRIDEGPPAPAAP